jgi:hypothetical protein
MPAKKSQPEPDAKRQQELLKKIYSLYADYTGQEIAQAIGQYRAEETARQEQIRIKQEIARLESQLLE